MIDPQTAPPGTLVKCVGVGGMVSGYLSVNRVYEVRGWHPSGYVSIENDHGNVADYAPIRFVVSAAFSVSPASPPVARSAPTPATAPVGSWVEAKQDIPPFTTVGRLYLVGGWPQSDIISTKLDDGSIQDVFCFRFLTYSGPAPVTSPVVPPPHIATVRRGSVAIQGVTYARPNSSAMFIPADWDAHTTVDLDDPKPNQCPVCSIELCPELDTCWDKDAWYAGYCAKCQVKARTGGAQ